MNVEIGTVAGQFLFWAYVFSIFGIVRIVVLESLQNYQKGPWIFFFKLVDSEKGKCWEE
jgi:hypothetical protein